MAAVDADSQRTGSIVQQAAPIDGGGPSDIGSGWRPRTRAAGSQEAEGRCTLGKIAMCNVQRTCGCFQTTGDEGARGCRIEGPNAAAWTAATHCPQTQGKCRPAKGSEPSAGGPATAAAAAGGRRRDGPGGRVCDGWRAGGDV
jgi:hypothetical protein